ncbi:MAG TPA: cupredoxin domain-containing protein [Firmicutes bacterium]|nr:cupredoxin domain-containing protein [Bacillota bacterium]
MEVRGVYVPDRIELSAGVPAELRFVRHDPAECASRLLIPAFGVDRQLPLGVPVTVIIPNPTPGEFLFTCHHGIYHGHLVVRNARRQDGSKRGVKS